MQNPFSNVVTDVQGCQPQQRPERLIDGIAHDLQKSGNQQTRELGDELEKIKPQLVQAFRGQNTG